MYRLVALDCDGVLLDYNAVYPVVWKKAFGTDLQRVNVNSYHASVEYGVTFADASQKEAFFAHFDEDAWASMPALAGALEACQELSRTGHELVCVTSMPTRFGAARLRNLQALGFPIDEVYAVGRTDGSNPKLDVIERLAPAAFVDDLAHNFRGISPRVHKALVHYGHHDSPNTPDMMSLADSTHGNLAGFVHAWLADAAQ